MWTHKTVPWRRARYNAHPDEADALRQEIADEAELDLSKFNLDEYDDSVVASPPDERDVDLLAHEQVLEPGSRPDEDQLARAIEEVREGGPLTIRRLRSRAEAIDARGGAAHRAAIQRGSGVVTHRTPQALRMALEQRLLSRSNELAGCASTWAATVMRSTTMTMPRIAAHDAQNVELATYVLCTMSHLATWQGNARVGLDHAIVAQAWASQTGNPRAEAYAADVAARAFAGDCQTDTCRKMLDTEQNAVTKITACTGSTATPRYGRI